MEKNNNFLGTEPVRKLLLKLSLPAIAAQIVNLLYNLVDRVYIGHMPENGDLALTGVGVCMSVIMIVSAFSAFVSTGGAPRASMAMGRGNQKEAEKILGNSLTLQILISVILTAVLLIFNRPLLLAFGASENTIGFATDYMNIYAMGTIFVQLTLGMTAFITAQGFATAGMFSVLIGAVCNIALDPLFIYGFHMGVKGAALATIISQAVSTFYVLRFLTGKKTILRIRRQNLLLETKTILPSFSLGMSSFIMQASESVILICFNSSLLKYGGDVAVGAMTILTSVMQFSSLPAQGLGQGAQPITSYNYGAKNGDRVKKTVKLLIACTLGYTMVVWSLVMLIPQMFARIFVPNPELIEFTSWALRIYCAGLGIFGAQIACQMTFTSLGNATASIMVAVMRKFILLVPLIYIVPHLVANKTMGVYLAEPIADFISVIFTIILFFFQFRKAMQNL
ncbi:MAG: MATE family efflux transporter [Eubacteriales bacterium]|nr:MATE family efflux transporter [Eubacteriales bacterium]